MNAAPLCADPTPAETEAWQRSKVIKAAWHRGEPPDTEAVLRAWPVLENDRNVLLDLIYEEYRLRREAGEAVDPEAFAARFPPSLREEVVDQVRMDRGFTIPNSVLYSVVPELRVLGPLVEQPVRWPKPGERLGDFTLVRELGCGTVARVFLAREASTGDRPVVLKLSCSRYGDQEAQTLGRLAHPNVVPIWSCRRDEELRLTITCMPFLGTATFEDVRRRVYRDPRRSPRRAAQLLDAAHSLRRPDDPPVPAGQAEPLLRHGSYPAGVLLLGARLAEVLAFLHVRGVCHRDLKPSNILLGTDGSPWLLDFNFSLRPEVKPELEGCSANYAAPEQIRHVLRMPGGTPADARSDVFSLGVILYELLTGRHPFGRVPDGWVVQEEGEKLLKRQQAGCALPAARGLPPAAARLIGRCLSFDPAKRPTAAALAAGLHEALAPSRMRRWANRHRWALWAAACLLPLVFGVFTPFRHSDAEGRLPHEAGEVAVYSPREAGIEAYNAGRYAEAVEHFTKAGDTQSRLYRGFALLKESRGMSAEDAGELIVSAEGDFRQALTRGPNAVVSACLAYDLSCQQRHKPAYEETDKDAANGRATTAVLNNRAVAFMQKGQLAAAERALAAINPQDRELPEVRYNRAFLAWLRSCQQQRGSVPAEALEDIRGFLDQIKPAPWEPYRYAAQLHACAAEDTGVLPVLREQRKEQAIRYLRSALERGMDPTRLDTDSAWRGLHGRSDFGALRHIQRPTGASRPLALLALRLINPAPERLE
jgi:serine/threonine protein kinase